MEIKNMINRHIALIIFTLFAIISCGGNDKGSNSNYTASNNDKLEPLRDSGVSGDGTLEERLNNIISKEFRPAIAVFSMSEGNVVEMSAVGLRSSESDIPVTVHDLWHIGSITKSMTATLSAFMVDDGLIEWETTIGDVFPEWSQSTLKKYQNLQFQQLLSHTSGLKDGFTHSAFANFDISGTGQEQRYSGGEMALSYDHSLPENSFLYANLNFMLAGAMLEKITGESWRTLITERVFQVLGMTEIGFGLPGDPELLDQPIGHLLNTPGDVEHFLSYEPAGLVHLSLASMAIYADFHLKGLRGEGGLLSKESYEKLYQAQSSGQAGFGPYALGWFVKGTTIFHSGTNGHWFAQLEIDSLENSAYFAVTNSTSANMLADFTSHGYVELAIGEALDLLADRLKAGRD